ncbi:hypothetical protein RJT34_32594 [Clitoria ternatea]|uniref:Uncharacterized protein n=1 Tax=Clitoria ternatea TaxID=43366 RepID=A0AAN9EYF8_CLITE
MSPPLLNGVGDRDKSCGKWSSTSSASDGKGASHQHLWPIKPRLLCFMETWQFPTDLSLFIELLLHNHHIVTLVLCGAMPSITHVIIGLLLFQLSHVNAIPSGTLLINGVGWDLPLPSNNNPKGLDLVN